MVEDPVAKIQFPKLAAGATLARDGKTLYFIDEQTREEFVKSESAGRS
jgi:YHS domain-containing protein